MFFTGILTEGPHSVWSENISNKNICTCVRKKIENLLLCWEGIFKINILFFKISLQVIIVIFEFLLYLVIRLRSFCLPSLRIKVCLQDITKKFKRICFSTNFTIYRFYNILKDVKAGNLYIPSTTFKWLKHCRKVEKPK